MKSPAGSQADKLRIRLIEVFTNWVNWSDNVEIESIKKILDDSLDEWASDDRFGTEGQNDPRGDARNLKSTPSI